ncbi:MAG: thioredoxin [Planctomycetota bacterium]
MTENTLQLDDRGFDREITQSKGAALVDFSAEWCAPCRALGPTVDAVANDFAGRATVAKVQVDDSPELANRFGVRSIPTLIFFRDGEEVDRVVGALSYAELQERLSGLAAA